MTWTNGCPTESGHYWVRFTGGDKHTYEDLVRVDSEGVVFFADGNGYWLPKEAKSCVTEYRKVDSVE